MMSNRLVFLVEGDCEIWFINHIIIPYLYRLPEATEYKWSMNAQKVTTNRHLNARGGVINYQLVKNEIQRLISQKNPWITTFFDYFRLPNSFPGFAQGYEAIEKEIVNDIHYERLLPYIQKHEFESLLFSVPEAFGKLDINEKQWDQIKAISHKYPCVEDINGGPDTAPSKRLQQIFHYVKTTDSKEVLKDVPIDVLMDRSPRFKQWIRALEDIVVR